MRLLVAAITGRCLLIPQRAPTLRKGTNCSSRIVPVVTHWSPHATSLGPASRGLSAGRRAQQKVSITIQTPSSRQTWCGTSKRWMH